MFMDSGRYRDKFSGFFEERYTAIVKYEMKTDYIKRGMALYDTVSERGIYRASQALAGLEFCFFQRQAAQGGLRS